MTNKRTTKTRKTQKFEFLCTRKSRRKCKRILIRQRTDTIEKLWINRT